MWRGLLGLGMVLVAGCGGVKGTDSCAATLEPGKFVCDVPGWKNRSYTVVVPDAYGEGDPIPVVMNLHGGSGSRKTTIRESCPDGDATNPACMHNALAENERFAVVYPNGHPGWGPAANLRTWNAGGGEGPWRATGKGAVEADVDDTQYIRDLLDDLEGRLSVDTQRVYAMGLSNGAAMTHRLACTLSERLAAVAPVGGAMQWTTTSTCEPDRAVPMLYVHSESDPCWVYEGGPSECPIGQGTLEHVSVARTLDEWASLHGCVGEPLEEALPDNDGDGQVTKRLSYEGCTAELTHLAPEGAGHTWPSGHQYLRESLVGSVDHDWGDEVFWAFFAQHALE